VQARLDLTSLGPATGSVTGEYNDRHQWVTFQLTALRPAVKQTDGVRVSAVGKQTFG
jgi:hypothetical protein